MEKTKRLLKRFIKKDNDFIQLYGRFKKQLKKQKLSYNKIIFLILNDCFENCKNETFLKNYFKDICYIEINNNIINLDFIYTCFNLFINEAIYC